MKTWTDTLTLAAVAVTLTLAACYDDAPELGKPQTPEEQAAEDFRRAMDMLGLRDQAQSAALDEIRRTFSVADFQAELYAERWPEIWGPDGWAWSRSHGDPIILLHDGIDGEMIERYGRDWEANEATVAEARATLTTELDRYLFDSFVGWEAHWREVRKRAVERMKELREEGVIRR